ncbi:hypothetical protein ACKWTF_013087 [Chironomus riparius]
MFELKDEISFPAIEQREERNRRVNEDINSNDINIIIESGIFAAIEKAKELGIYHEETSLKDLLSASTDQSETQAITNRIFFWIGIMKILSRSTRQLLFKMLNFLGLDQTMDILQLKRVMLQESLRKIS